MKVTTIAIPITRFNNNPSIIGVSCRAIFLCLCCCSGSCNLFFFSNFLPPLSMFPIISFLTLLWIVNSLIFLFLESCFTFNVFFQFHEWEDACWWTNFHCFHHLVVFHHLTKLQYSIFSRLLFPLSYNCNFDFGFIKQSFKIVNWSWILTSRAPSLLYGKDFFFFFCFVFFLGFFIMYL